MILHPKRWQKADDPRYDPIRHRPWFNRLLKRKHIIPRMDGCYAQWSSENAWSQEELCDLWNVSPREFRDYLKLKQMDFDLRKIPKEFTHILNEAYFRYCADQALMPIQRHIQAISPYYGVNYRHVREMWEVDPIFYPTNYAYPITSS